MLRLAVVAAAVVLPPVGTACWYPQRNYRLMWSKTSSEVGYDRDQSWTGSPATDGYNFFLDIGGAVVALDVATGDRRWFSRIREGMTSRIDHFTVYDDQLLFTLSGIAIALDRSNGRVEWMTRVDTIVTYAELASDSTMVYVGQSAGVTALDRATGEFRWMTSVRDSSQASARTVGVLVSGDTVYVALEQWQFSPTNSISRYARIAALDRQTGALIWLYRSKGDSSSVAGAGALAERTIVYSDGAGGSFFALDRRTGIERWRVVGDRESGSAGPSESPIIRQDTVYVGSGDTWIYAANVDSGKLLWRTKTEGSIRAIAVCEDLLLANNDRIEFVDRFNGHLHQAYLGGHDNSAHAGYPTSGIAIAGNIAMVVGSETVVGFRCGKHVRD